MIASSGQYTLPFVIPPTPGKQKHRQKSKGSETERTYTWGIGGRPIAANDNVVVENDEEENDEAVFLTGFLFGLELVAYSTAGE